MHRIFRILPHPEKILVDKQLDYPFLKQHLFITTSNLVSYGIGGVIGGLYFYTNHWSLNNIIGICFSIVGIMFMKISNYKIILVLLWLLFFYDIFMVFKSDMMITVAKNLNVPIKLILPYNDKPSIIGLGDIVLPGVLVAWSLKFDIDKALEDRSLSNNKQPFQKPNLIYFWTSLVAYMCGIVSTFIAMTIMKHGQPALLYLVPWTTISVLIQAIY